MKVVLLLAVFFGIFAFVYSQLIRDALSFKEWIQKYEKQYENALEYEKALTNYMKNKRSVEAHNKNFKSGIETYTRSLNKFSDKLVQDLSKIALGLKIPPILHGEEPNPDDYPPNGESVDWRDFGLVGPVEDQGGCGSCWTYSSKGVVEAILRRKNIKTPVSSQQLVDCSKEECWGCDGGWPQNALNYIKSNGSASQSSYPYKGEDGTCSYDQSKKLDLNLNQTHLFYLNGKSDQ
jgi:C1A family cysteine protease